MERISRRCFQEIFSHKNTANERESFPQTTLVTAILQQKITSIIAGNAQISQQDSARVYPQIFAFTSPFPRPIWFPSFPEKLENVHGYVAEIFTENATGLITALKAVL